MGRGVEAVFSMWIQVMSFTILFEGQWSVTLGTIFFSILTTCMTTGKLMKRACEHIKGWNELGQGSESHTIQMWLFLPILVFSFIGTVIRLLVVLEPEFMGAFVDWVFVLDLGALGLLVFESLVVLSYRPLHAFVLSSFCQRV